ncbi:MAG: FAD-dependent oxidoreductase [Synergistaceae bacterium]|nr:FAD-dependent oxidoreductase [Synergistaceae bacterium]
MANKRFDIIIIGNGVAGNAAALAARKADPNISIAVVEELPHPIYAAGALPDYLAGDLKKEDVFMAEDPLARTIDFYLGARVESVDPKRKRVTTNSGQIMRYGKLILASGSVPVQLRKMQGTALSGNFVLKTVADAERIAAYPAKRAVVVGSGAIGTESALALAGRGIAVTIVELLEWVNKKALDYATASRVVKELEARKIRVHTSENVVAVEGETRVEAAVTSKRVIPCDLIIWAVGVRPVVDLAARTGITLGETGGVKTDEYMQTNYPDIYACGDCTESVDQFRCKPVLNMLWESAARQGKVAGSCAAGIDATFDTSSAVLITYIGDKPVVAFGATEADLAGSGAPYEILERETMDSYSRVLLQGDRVVGAQMLFTMEGAALLLAQHKKGEPVERRPGKIEEHMRYPAQQAALAAFLERFKSRRVKR